MILPSRDTMSQHKRGEIFEYEGESFVQLWYPQMGGYTSVCLVHLNKPQPGMVVSSQNDIYGCFDIYLFHDTEFPTDGDLPSLEIHHCDADQFVQFGQQVKAAQLAVFEEQKPK